MSNNTPKFLGAALGLLVIAVLVLVGVSIRKPIVIENHIEVPPSSATPSFGSLAGPDIMNPYFSYGGVRNWGYSTTLNQASTTLCSFVSPVSTSTLQAASIMVTRGTTTAIAIEIGKGTASTPATMDATTTRLVYTGALASGAQATIKTFVASTTLAIGTNLYSYTMNPDDMTFAPNTRLNFKYGGANGSLNVLQGNCKAEFTEN